MSPTRRLRCLRLAAVLCFALCALAQEPPAPAPAPLAIAPIPMPPALTREDFLVKMQATGGKSPLHWSIYAGALPPGLSLDALSGAISGAPAAAGEFHFTVEVGDSSQLPQRRYRELTIRVSPPLVLEWANYPRVDGDAISGSVKVSNGTGDIFDQTVIVVAVNDYGKAFVLGYQRFDLQPDEEKVEIPFTLRLPRGSYTIHADAIAEVAAKNSIRRSRLQTAKPLPVVAP